MKADVTLTAHWTKAQHTVTFVPGDNATFNGDTSVKVDDGAKVSKPTKDPTKTGYMFVCWYKKGDTQKAAWKFESDMVTSDITLVAEFKKAQHTVTFDANGGTFSGKTSVTVDDNSTLTEPTTAPTKAGSTFAGWFKDETTKWDFANDTVKADVTITAHWTIASNPSNPSTSGTSDTPTDTPSTPDTPGSTKPNTHKTHPQTGFTTDPQTEPQIGFDISARDEPHGESQDSTQDASQEGLNTAQQAEKQANIAGNAKKANASSSSKFLPATGDSSSLYAGIIGCLSALAATLVGLTVFAKRKYNNAQ